MGPVWDVYGLPIWARSYRTHKGPIRTKPYGLPIMDPCGAQIAIPYGPCVGCLRHAHIGTIWVPYAQAHIGTPINDPCWAQIASPYGPRVGCIPDCPYGPPIMDRKLPFLALILYHSMVILRSRGLSF